MLGAFIIGLISGAMVGFLTCAIIVASQDEK